MTDSGMNTETEEFFRDLYGEKIGTPEQDSSSSDYHPDHPVDSIMEDAELGVVEYLVRDKARVLPDGGEVSEEPESDYWGDTDCLAGSGYLEESDQDLVTDGGYSESQSGFPTLDSLGDRKSVDSEESSEDGFSLGEMPV